MGYNYAWFRNLRSFDLQRKDVNINAALASVKQLLVEEKSLSPAFRAAIELLVLIVTLLGNRLFIACGDDAHLYAGGEQ